MKAKRMICLLLALLMVMGSVSWLITLIASADGTESESVSSVLAAYSLEKVYSGRTSAEKDKPCYIKGDSSKTAYKIHSGYYADFLVSLSMTFEDEAAAQAFEEKKDSLEVAVDSGSFSSNEKAGTHLDVTDVKLSGKNATVFIEMEKLLYSGKGDTLGFTLYDDGNYFSSHAIPISQCVPTEPSADTDDEDEDENTANIPDPTPYVIISSYNYGGEAVTAGQEFVLNIELENTSVIPVGNMTMTVTPPEAFTLVSSSNTVYIENLGAHETFSHSIPMMVRASAEPEPGVVEVSFHYQYISDETRKDVERSERIAIPVNQRDRFQVEDFTLPEQIWVGEEYDLEVNYVNKGRSLVYNLSATIEGEGLAQPNQSENVGNVESGKSGTFDFFLSANEPGILSGNIIITYEDVNMNEKEIVKPFSVEVMGMEMEEPVYDPMGDIVYNEDGTYYGPDGILYGPDGMPVEEGKPWVPYAIGAAALAAIVAAVVIGKKRKAARLLAELEEDDNEDI